MRHQNAAQAPEPMPCQKGPSVGSDIYDLSPMAFAKNIGLIPPKDPLGALSYKGLLGLALSRYYDRNTHLARPLPLAS